MKNKFLILSLLLGTLKTISPMESPWIEWGIGEGEIHSDWRTFRERPDQYTPTTTLSPENAVSTHLSEGSARFNLALFLQKSEHSKIQKQVEVLNEKYRSNQEKQFLLERDLSLNPADEIKKQKLLDLKRKQVKIYSTYVALCLQAEQPF